MQAYNVFILQLYKLAVWMIPKDQRTAKYSVLVKAVVFPLIAVHSLFMLFRSAKNYQLGISGQKVKLERMLNDKYDSSVRRIYIDDAVWHLPWFLYLEAENKPEYLFLESEGQPVPLYTDGEAGTALNDFVVWVPVQVVFDTAEMRSLIDSYRLYGTKYTIQTF